MDRYILSFPKDAKIIELGGGDHPIVRPNADIRKLNNVDIICDFNKSLPMESNSYYGLISLYCLEHISWKNLTNFVKEVYRILKSNGKAVFLVPNTYEQCKKVAESEKWEEGFSCMLYGSQDYNENAHACAFSPEYAKQLFMNNGFNSVNVISPMPDVFFGDRALYPRCDTDMVIECKKISNEEVFERSYFDSDGDTGYIGTGYRNFTAHYATARKIMEMFPNKPKVLEIGAARGYVTRILENNGLKAIAMDISKHCLHTRATNSFILHDLTDVPWSKGRVYGDKSFDLCFSQNVLEHIPEEQIDKVITEIARVSHKGLHGIHYTGAPYQESPDVDITHRTMHPKSWWIDKFKTIAPDYPVTIMYPRELENDDVEKCIAYPPKKTDDLVKLNIGSFTDMFYNWINIDIIDLQAFAQSQGYIFQQHDVLQGIPYADNSVDLIFSSHLIEHLSREEGARFLKECHRVLKPDGVIRISTPNAEKLTTEYLNGQIMEYKYINVGVEQAKDSAEAYFQLLLAGHKTIYDTKALGLMLKEAGFNVLPSVTPFTSNSDTIQKQTITNFPTLSSIVEAKVIEK